MDEKIKDFSKENRQTKEKEKRIKRKEEIYSGESGESSEEESEESRSGFFCKFSFKNETKKVFMTNYHVLNNKNFK